MKTYKYIAALLLTGVVVSCQNDETISPAYENDPDAVRIQANIAALQTRVNTDRHLDQLMRKSQGQNVCLCAAFLGKHPVGIADEVFIFAPFSIRLLFRQHEG